MKYYYPFSELDDNYEDFKWRMTDEYKNAVCEECNGVSLDHMGKPFDIIVRREPKMFDPSHPGATILQAGYAEFLRSHDFENRIVWGSVLIGKKRVVSDRYVTAYMPSSNTVHVRGDDRAVYYACSLCGRRNLGMYECGDEYLVSADTNYDMLFSSGRSYALVSERIIFKYDWKQHPEVILQEFPVLDCPLDGFRLPGDPNWALVCPNFKPNNRKKWCQSG